MTQVDADVMEKVVSLAKRRGLIFPSSEIYGGLGSTWDYGPLGVLLKNNVKAAWWRAVVQQRQDMVGMDAAILMHPEAWRASGHIETFHDPLVDDKQTQQRYRADHLIEQLLRELADGTPSPLVRKGHEAAIAESATWIRANSVEALLKDKARTTELFSHMQAPSGGELTEPRNFNLMFKTFLGPVEDSAAVVYLRPETAQGIFVNFKSVQIATRKKPPFGIAQIGKSFRNEITPGNFTFRTREFEQMEIEFFCPPAEADKWFDHWVEERYRWYTDLGMKPENIRRRPHGSDELAHYARGCQDFEYRFPFGWSELEGVANRTDFDLTQHEKFSGKDLKYFEEEAKLAYVPYVIEPSAGADRATLAFLVDSYAEETDDKGETRVVLRLHPMLAPFKVAVLPLSKKPELSAPARALADHLASFWNVDYDETQSIGKRYRRQDEVGTPFCVTLDFDSLNDHSVTVRERDGMTQVRLKVEELVPWLQARLQWPNAATSMPAIFQAAAGAPAGSA
ncbi:MAG: glycyl-tRNA synthetase [Cyanobacteria bacterium RYN_339]|nr:glycyl-tRNA synthetase [Cyanobacteria bacterium RYN_339]